VKFPALAMLQIYATANLLDATTEAVIASAVAVLVVGSSEEVCLVIAA
jgi:hypothetical protein